MSAIFPFIFNTIRARANCCENEEFFLPKVLQNIDKPAGGKLLPIRDQKWSFGTIDGETGRSITFAIIAAARSFSDGQPVNPDIKNPYPQLSVDLVEILGLNNLFVDSNSPWRSIDNGYNATIMLEFNAWKSMEIKTVDLEPFKLEGQYTLKVNILIGDKPTEITGSGTFETDITNCKLVAEVEITTDIKNKDWRPIVTIKSLDLLGVEKDTRPNVDTGVFSISHVDPEYEKIWTALANEALNQQNTKTTLLTNIQAVLNTNNNLNSLSGTMTSQLENIFNKAFDELPAEAIYSSQGLELENPADIYVFERIRMDMNNSNSKFYLPKQLLNLNSPQLEPYTAEKLDLGSLDIEGLTWNPNILTDIVITGLSNEIVQSDQITFSNGILSITAIQGALVTEGERNIGGKTIPKPPLIIATKFSLQPLGMNAITGNIKIMVETSNLEIQATVSGIDVDSMNIIMKKLELKVQPSSINMSIDFLSNFGFNTFAQKVLNDSSVTKKVLDFINKKLEDKLNEIGLQVTNSIKDSVSKQLGESTN